ncbi:MULTISPECIES: AzlD domain-containing protein [unclassified Beijerinckia]|uniref:AzlD domain-containing protein n=1 Tax=unclassified Beijerinckia TaxID=2638183 RepID=UPI000897B052|nr:MULTISPECIES: AzlD domain-containing protein [unclassified Beijerinckia]MDH7794524.1 hypothetical protein [Beijerinckia sp. GAS462]SEB65310.1 Branched-chain amino acid transport protein (AzlD) [Beijerinckia sp. 28-YEA-48]
MTPDAWSGGLWPYFALILFGFLPSEVWRMLSVLVGHSIDEKSELLEWVRAVATALLAGVVANILLTPSGALATVPLLARFGAMAIGLTAFALTRRSVIAGVAIGEIAIVGAAWWFAP